MLLTDFPIGESLLVEATLKTTNKKINFKTEIVDVNYSSGKIIVEPIMLKKQIVNFSLCNCNLFIFRENKKPIIFKDVQITNIEINDKKYHQICSINEGEKFNRRKEFRCIINKDCEVSTNQIKYKGLLKNISNSGFCFSIKKSYFNNDIDIQVKDNVKIYFEDNDLEGKNFIFSLIGNIIWIGEDDDHFIFGGQLIEKEEKIPNYIMIKQREELKRIKGKRK